jgi:hypothetical protein
MAPALVSQRICVTVDICTATKIPFKYFQKMKLRDLSPNFHIHVSASDLYIPRIDPHIFLQQNNVGRPIMGMYKLLIDA